MYIPKHFEPVDAAAVDDLIRAYPLGALVTQLDGELDANHIPFEWLPEQGAQGTLLAHVARANPVSQSANGVDVMVIFRGPEAYVTPTWYPSKQETHRLVPTWNYQVVHAHGKLRIRDDERFVRGLVARLTHSHERDREVPWKMTDSPPDHIATMLKAIVGIEIEVTRLVGKFKLSQNRELRDRIGLADGLIAEGAGDLGNAVLGSIDPRERPTASS